MRRIASRPADATALRSGQKENDRRSVHDASRVTTRKPAARGAFPGAVLAFWFACLGPAAADPAAGQTVPEFEAAIVASLAHQGDRMGYALLPCALDPPFVTPGTTYVGRVFSERAEQGVVLVAVEAGRVTRWAEYDLPDLEGWLTHSTTCCRKSTLAVVHGRMIQRYRWNGRAFIRQR